jgi:hypothetical protein
VTFDCSKMPHALLHQRHQKIFIQTPRAVKGGASRSVGSICETTWAWERSKFLASLYLETITETLCSTGTRDDLCTVNETGAQSTQHADLLSRWRVVSRSVSEFATEPAKSIHQWSRERRAASTLPPLPARPPAARSIRMRSTCLSLLR